MIAKKIITGGLWLLCAAAAFARAAQPEEDERWQLKFEAAWVQQLKPSFHAAYSGANSLSPNRDHTWTTTATAFAGLRLWQGGEIYVNPEMVAGVAVSNLHGLGGFYNGEISRASESTPRLYAARAFVRQTWNLGGASERLESDANQLATTVSTERLVMSFGKMAAIDMFDDNRYSQDPRTQFMNWSLMAMAGWDYPADARGYTWGLALEYITPRWALRVGRFLQPKESNGEQLRYSPFASYGDVGEVRRSFDTPYGASNVRILGYHNRAPMGSYGIAVNNALAFGTTPDLATTRASRSKWGAGVNVDHDFGKGMGAFLRASFNNGVAEEWAFTEVDRSLTAGIVLQGSRWRRAADEWGVALVANGLSKSHRDYLALGGLGFFLGDGALSYGPEQIAETYYRFGLGKHTQLSFDYQFIRNPGYNRDRGPANFAGVRLRVEF